MLTEKVVLDNVIKYVRTMLGDKTVEVELTRAELLTLIEQALRKLRPYYSGVRYVQANGKQIDVSNHDPIAVSRVWNAGDAQYSAIEDYMFGGVGLMIYDINFTQRFELMQAYRMLWNELSNQKGENFRLLNNTIYLDGYLDNALIEMTVNLKTITDVEESSMYADWILDYTLALAKEVLGRKRGKATLQGSPIQLDAAQLLSEAASEKTHLEDQLVRRHLYLLERSKIMRRTIKLIEKASIDWNNYLTPEEVKRFKSKDDKIEAAGEIIYDKEFKDRLEDFKKSGWTDEQLIDDLFSFDLNKHLTEGMHLFAFVKDEDGNNKIIEDSDYPDKKSFENDLRANGYTIRRINDEKDMFIMDNSDYRSLNEVTNKIKQIEKDIKDGIALPSEKIELSNLKELLNKVR